MLRELLRQEQSFAFLNPRRVWERRVASPGIHINQVDLVISEDKLFLIFFSISKSLSCKSLAAVLSIEQTWSGDRV